MLNTLLQRELLNTWRNPQALLQPLLFFLLTVCLFPIASGVDNQNLQHITPPALWIALLFATLLASERFFTHDYHHGILSQDILHLSDYWLSLIAKLLAAWLGFILPLLACLPLLMILLHIPWSILGLMIALLSLGSFCLLLIAMLGAALTLSQTHNSFLKFLIVMPLFMPLLIIGVSATRDSLLGLPVYGHIALLAALTLFSCISIIPFASLAIKAQSLP